MRCADCPHPGPAACPGAAAPAVCELRRRDPGYLRLARGEVPVRARAPRDAIGAQRLLVLSCDYRGPVVARGCSCRHACFRGECGGAVTYGDCLRCVGAGPVA